MHGSEKIYLQSNDVTVCDHEHTYDVTVWDHEHLYDVIHGTTNVCTYTYVFVFVSSLSIISA